MSLIAEDQVEFVVEDYLKPWTAGWPDARRGPWDVTLHWRADDDGAVVCVGYDVRLRENVKPRPWTTAEHRRLRLNELVKLARAERYRAAGGDLVDAIDEGQDIDVSMTFVEGLRVEASGWRHASRAGAPKQDNVDELHAVATTYTQAMAAGAPVLETVMKRHHMSKATASRRIKSARDAGLLPPTTRGVRSGNPRLLTGRGKS